MYEIVRKDLIDQLAERVPNKKEDDDTVLARMALQAVVDLQRSTKVVSSGILRGLWDIYTKGYYRYDEAEPSTFEEWADQHNDEEDGVPLQTWVNVMMTQIVWLQSYDGPPINDKAGNEITVARLLADETRCANKLKNSRSTFVKATDEQRVELVREIVDGTQATVAQLCKEISNGTAANAVGEAVAKFKIVRTPVGKLGFKYEIVCSKIEEAMEFEDTLADFVEFVDEPR